MPAPAPYIAHGIFEGWMPGLRKKRRINDLDTITGSYLADSEDALMPGDAVPDFPGMIIMDADEEENAGGSVAYRINGMGSLDNLRPAKIVSTRIRRSNEPTWDSLSQELYHPLCDEYFFGAGTDDRLNVGLARFADDDVIKILSVTGAAPLDTETTYYVVNADSNYIKLSLTPGGDPVDITTTGTGSLVLAQFARGSQYVALNVGSISSLYLSEVESDDQSEHNLPFKRVRLNYLGIYGPKPYKRSITVNGKTISNDNFRVLFPGGGWGDFRKGTAQQPTLEVSDIHVFATDPNLYEHVPTSDVFDEAGESRTIPAAIVIPSPPNVNTIFGSISGSDVVSQWPNRWSFVGCEKVDEIPGTTVVMIRKVWRYEWQATL